MCSPAKSLSFFIRGQVKSMINLDDRKTRCLSLDNICVVIGGSQWGGYFYGLRLSVVVSAICCLFVHLFLYG